MADLKEVVKAVKARPTLQAFHPMLLIMDCQAVDNVVEKTKQKEEKEAMEAAEFAEDDDDVIHVHTHHQPIFVPDSSGEDGSVCDCLIHSAIPERFNL